MAVEYKYLSFPNLCTLIQRILDPGTKQHDRKEAHEVIESFKQNNSDLCWQHGVQLYRGQNIFQLKHIGLQLMEHVTRFKWGSIGCEAREACKREVMNMLCEVDGDIPGHLKESLARLAVELIKKEWPQNWPNLFQDLGHVYSLKPCCTEIVLIILLRLAEDVVSLDANLTTQRRKDMLSTLNDNVENLFEMFIDLLCRNTSQYQSQGDLSSRRLAEATLFTLTGYLDWVAFSHIFMKNKVILQALCLLLEDTYLQQAAVTCLLMLVQRKGKIDDRLPFIVLFSADAMDVIISAIKNASTLEDNEESYTFLKSACEVLRYLGCVQLTQIWGDARGIKHKPDNLHCYLRLMIDLSNHDSKVLCNEALTAWSSFLNHEIMCKDEEFLCLIPELLEMCLIKLEKVEDPLHGDHPSCKYSLIDFESEEEYHHHSGNLKCQLATIIRLCTKLRPIDSFQTWLSKASNKVLYDTSQPADVVRCVWGSFAYFTETVLGTFLRIPNILDSPTFVCNGSSIDFISNCSQLITEILKFKSKDPLVLSSLLTCLQAMFPAMKHNTDVLNSVIKQIIDWVRYSDNTATDIQHKNINLFKKQAACSFTMLCKTNAEFLLNYFAELVPLVKSLFVDEHVSQHDTTSLIEGLLLISLKLPTIEERTLFCADVLSPAAETFNRTDVQSALNNSQSFVTFLGIGQNSTVSATTVDNAVKLEEAVAFVLAVVKRFKMAQEYKEEVQPPIPNHIQAEQTCLDQQFVTLLTPFLKHILDVIRSLSLLYVPENLALISKDFLSCFELNESELNAVQSLSWTLPVTRNNCSIEIQKTRYHLSTMFENSIQAIGHSCTSLGPKLYELPGLADALINSLLIPSQHVILYRQRFMWRSFMKMFLYAAPWMSYDDVIAPVVSTFLHLTYTRLSEEWKKTDKHMKLTNASTSNENENGVPSQEVIGDCVTAMVTRDYVDMLSSVCCYNKKIKSEIGSEKCEPSLSDLANYLICCESSSHLLVFTVFNALTWSDATIVNKLSRLIFLLIDKVFSKDRAKELDPAVVEHVFRLMLESLNRHGNDAAAQGVLLTATLMMYTNTRMTHPRLVDSLLCIPGCERDKLIQFDLNVFDEEKLMSEKSKRNEFKKLISGAIEKNMSELYKNEIDLSTLPPLAPRRKPKSTVFDTDIDNVNSISDLFNAS